MNYTVQFKIVAKRRIQYAYTKNWNLW